MTLSRPPPAEHYPAAGQTRKPMCGALPRNREQTFREPPGDDFRAGRHGCGRCGDRRGCPPDAGGVGRASVRAPGEPGDTLGPPRRGACPSPLRVFLTGIHRPW